MNYFIILIGFLLYAVLFFFIWRDQYTLHYDTKDGSRKYIKNPFLRCLVAMVAIPLCGIFLAIGAICLAVLAFFFTIPIWIWFVALVA